MKSRMRSSEVAAEIILDACADATGFYQAADYVLTAGSCMLSGWVSALSDCERSSQRTKK